MRRVWIALALAAGAASMVIGGGAARAGDRKPDKKPPADPAVRVALVQLRIGGDVAAALRDQLEQSISRGLAGAGLEAVLHDDVRAALAGTQLLDCTSVACLEEMAGRLNASRFLRAGLEGSGAAYNVELEIVDRSGTGMRRLRDDCPVCTISELNELIERLAHDLVTAPDITPVQVEIVSRPGGAALQIDGKPVGNAPFTGELAPGPHTVTALRTGYEEAEKTIEVHPDQPQQRFEIILELPSAPPPPPPPPPRPFRAWKWVAAGGAGVALLGGVVLVAMDGKQTCDLQGEQLECPERWNTLPAGLLSAGIGVAAGAASAWMFIRDRRDRRPRPKLSFTHGGAIVGAAWRF